MTIQIVDAGIADLVEEKRSLSEYFSSLISHLP